MGKLLLNLVTGRTTRQGTGISAGKVERDYQDATGVLHMNPSDMKRSGLNEGDRVRVTTGLGSADLPCRAAELPEGIAFMAFGSVCNRLVGDQTYASGMPDSKNITVEITKIAPGAG